MRKKNASSLAAVSILLAIMVILQVLTTTLFNILPLPIKPTLIHIPVIIGSILYGPRVGGSLGYMMGFMSLITNSLAPTPISYVFSPLVPGGSFDSILVAILPRIMVGIIPYLVYKVLHNRTGLILAGLLGSLTNTVLVLTSIFLLFSQVYAGNILALLAGVFTSNSLLEMILAAFLTAAIIPVLEKR